MIKLSKMTVVVLAGGKSRRFGRDKRGEIIGGQTLLERVMGRLSKIGDEIILVVAADSPPVAWVSPQGGPAAKVVIDHFPNKGALGGIYTGVAEAASFQSLVVAGDMPFLNPGLLRLMIGLADGFDVVVPLVWGHLEPLHAIYSKNCLGPMERLMQRTDLKVIDFFAEVKVRTIPEEVVTELDPQLRSFFNINTEAHLAQARELVALESGSND